MDTKTLCLAVLTRGDASGYEIKKTLEQPPFCHFQETSFGSIYPALGKLTEQGLAHCRDMAQEKRPDKKVYAITEAGRESLREALMVPPGPDKYRSDFLFILFMGHLLPNGQVAGMIEERLAFYEESIANMESCACDNQREGEKFVHGFGLTFYRAAADHLRRNRDDLLNQEPEIPRQVAE